MNKVNLIILISSIIVFLIIVLFVLFAHLKSKLKYLVYKLDNGYNSIISKLKEKHEILLRQINIVETKFKIESKTFDEIKNIKPDKISFKSDIVLCKCYDEILKIKEDRNKTRELKSFRETFDDYNEIELHVVSLRTYYNKNVLELNNLLKKFPYKLIGNLLKIKAKLLFEGHELTEIID